MARAKVKFIHPADITCEGVFRIETPEMFFPIIKEQPYLGYDYGVGTISEWNCP